MYVNSLPLFCDLPRLRLVDTCSSQEYNHNLVNGYGAIEGEAEDEGEDEPVKVVGFPISEGMAGEGKISVKVSEKWTLDLVAKGRAQVKATLKSDTGEEISLPAEGRGPSFHPRFGEEQGALASGLADGAEGCIVSLSEIPPPTGQLTLTMGCAVLPRIPSHDPPPRGSLCDDRV